MFCSACGQPIQPGARCCMNCGAATTAGPTGSWPGAAAPAPAGIHTPDGFRLLAGFGQRLGAYLIDAIIHIIPMVALIVALVFLAIEAYGLANEDTTEVDAATYAFLSVLVIGGLAAFAWAWGYRWWGNATSRPFGKRLVGIRVVRETTGLPPGAGIGFVRTIVEFALSLFSPLHLIDYLWPLWDARKQAIHDKAAGTVVVREAVSDAPLWDDDLGYSGGTTRTT